MAESPELINEEGDFDYESPDLFDEEGDFAIKYDKEAYFSPEVPLQLTKRSQTEVCSASGDDTDSDDSGRSSTVPKRGKEPLRKPQVDQLI